MLNRPPRLKMVNRYPLARPPLSTFTNRLLPLDSCQHDRDTLWLPPPRGRVIPTCNMAHSCVGPPKSPSPVVGMSKQLSNQVVAASRWGSTAVETATAESFGDAVSVQHIGGIRLRYNCAEHDSRSQDTTYQLTLQFQFHKAKTSKQSQSPSQQTSSQNLT